MPTIDERELEDFLMEPGNLQHIEVYGGDSYATRQLNLGQYGIPDIVLIQPAIREVHGCDYDVTVIELKKDELNAGTLMQACRYVAGLKQFIRKLSKIKNPIIESRVVLAGKTINTNDWTFLGHHLMDVRVWTYSLSLHEGISFIEHELEDYVLTGAQAPSNFTNLFTELIEPRGAADAARYRDSVAQKQISAPPEVKVEEVHG